MSYFSTSCITTVRQSPVLHCSSENAATYGIQIWNAQIIKVRHDAASSVGAAEIISSWFTNVWEVRRLLTHINGKKEITTKHPKKKEWSAKENMTEETTTYMKRSWLTTETFYKYHGFMLALSHTHKLKIFPQVTKENILTFSQLTTLQLTTLSLRPLLARCWETLLTVSSSEEHWEKELHTNTRTWWCKKKKKKSILQALSQVFFQQQPLQA